MTNTALRVSRGISVPRMPHFLAAICPTTNNPDPKMKMSDPGRSRRTSSEHQPNPLDELPSLTLS